MVTKSLNGMIYAKDAKISDFTEVGDKAPETHHRYSDDSDIYAEGFKFDKDLDSYMWNGFLHAVSERVNEIEKCNVSKEADIGFFTRYASQNEITDPKFISDDTYIKKDQKQALVSSRYDLFRLEQATSFFPKLQRKKQGVLDSAETKKAIAIANGTDLPLFMMSDIYGKPHPEDLQNVSQFMEAHENAINVFNVHESESNLYCGLVINVLKDDKLRIYQAKNTKNISNNYTRTINLIFTQDIRYRNVSIPKYQKFSIDNFQIILKNSTVYFIRGLNYTPLINALQSVDQELIRYAKEQL